MGPEQSAMLWLILLPLAVALLLAGITLWGATRAARSADEDWRIAMGVAWVIGLGWLVALVYLLVVRPRRARASRAWDGASPPPPLAPGTGPRWTADPTGHFEHRYWDGHQWTAHVATGGVQSEDEPTRPTTDLGAVPTGARRAERAHRLGDVGQLSNAATTGAVFE